MERLVNLLRELAVELRPFIPAQEKLPAGTLVWNDTEYARPGTGRPGDPFALAWWSTLTTAADLLEAQRSSVSADQTAYLRKELFGGMGSFQDFTLDPDRLGDEAAAANRRVEEKLKTLFSLLNALEQSEPHN